MMIELPIELESTIRAAIQSGQFTSAEELVAQAVRSFLQSTVRPSTPVLGSIGFMRDATELDAVVTDAYRRRQEDTWRDIDLG